MSDLRIAAHLRRRVRARARARCDYCHLPDPWAVNAFHFDHVLARKHGGRTTAANLAYCCASCNLHKGSDIAGYDRTTRKIVPLFHPRRDGWHSHFRWSGPVLFGRSAKGPATVATLSMNNPTLLNLRASLMEEGLL